MPKSIFGVTIFLSFWTRRFSNQSASSPHFYFLKEVVGMPHEKPTGDSQSKFAKPKTHDPWAVAPTTSHGSSHGYTWVWTQQYSHQQTDSRVEFTRLRLSRQKGHDWDHPRLKQTPKYTSAPSNYLQTEMQKVFLQERRKYQRLLRQKDWFDSISLWTVSLWILNIPSLEGKAKK